MKALAENMPIVGVYSYIRSCEYMEGNGTRIDSSDACSVFRHFDTTEADTEAHAAEKDACFHTSSEGA